MERDVGQLPVEDKIGRKDERYFISRMSSIRGTAPSGMAVLISSSRRSLIVRLRARQYDLKRGQGLRQPGKATLHKIKTDGCT